MCIYFFLSYCSETSQEWSLWCVDVHLRLDIFKMAAVAMVTRNFFFKIWCDCHRDDHWDVQMCTQGWNFPNGHPSKVIADWSTAESGIKIPLNQSNRSQTKKVKLVGGICMPTFFKWLSKKCLLNYKFLNVNYQVGSGLSLAEFVGET